MLDHLPLLCLLKQTKIIDKSPLVFDSRNLNDGKLTEIKTNLYNVDWVGLLNKNFSTENIDLFCNKLNQVMDSTAPIKSIRISSKCRFTKPWMSKGIETASRKKMELYR